MFRYISDLFRFDRSEELLMSRPLEEVLRDAQDGAEQDERETLPPNVDGNEESR